MHESVILHQSKEKGLGCVRFNFPPPMKRYIDSKHSWNSVHVITPLTPSGLVTKFACQ